MNKMPPSVVLLSVIVAVVLWYLATLLEGDGPWLEEASTAEPPAAFGRSTGDTPVLGGTAAIECQQAEREMQSTVDDARHCEADADCTIFDYGYPIQCMTSVATNEITALRLKYREYEESCLHRVYYDCPSEPLERHAVCRNNRCEVELRTLDFLKDETLQHIGGNRRESRRRAGKQ
jgi:hypothetical protein